MQTKPRGKQALHNPTVASKAVLTRTRNSNATSVSHRTPVQHIAKRQRCIVCIDTAGPPATFVAQRGLYWAPPQSSCQESFSDCLG